MNTMAILLSAPESAPLLKNRKTTYTFSRLPGAGARRYRAGVLLRLLCAGLLALAGMALSAGAHGQGVQDPIVSNFGVTSLDNILGLPSSISGHVLLGNSKDAAQGFTTGAYPRSGITLTSIDVSLRTATGTAVPTAKLVTLEPDGSTLTTLTTTDTLSQNTTSNIVNYRPGSTVKLAASTTYWLVLESGTDDTGWNYTCQITQKVPALAQAEILNARVTRNADSNGPFTEQPEAFRLKVFGLPDFPSPADPGKVLLSNMRTAGNSTNLQLTTLTGHVAQEFDPGTNMFGYNLESIDVAFADVIAPSGINSLSATVWSLDSSGHPETRQFVLTNPAHIRRMQHPAQSLRVVGQVATFTAPSNSNLDRNTRYAIVLASAAGNIKLFATGVDVTGLDTTALVSADSGSTWTQTSGSNQLMIRVNGTAAGNILPSPLPTNILEDPIVSNLVAPGPISGHVLLGNSKDAAQGFTTGAYPRSGITLTSIRRKFTHRSKSTQYPPVSEAGHRGANWQYIHHINFHSYTHSE